MRTRLIATLICLAVMSAVGPQASAEQPKETERCVFDWYNGKAPPDVAAVFQIVRCYATDGGVDAEHAVATVDCESSGYPFAVNGPYAGPWQYHPKTWAYWWSVVREWFKVRHAPKRYVRGPNGWVGDRRMDPRASSATATFQIKQTGWGAWSCA